MSLHCIGAVEIGEGYADAISLALQTAGGLTTGITSMVEKEQARKKSETEEKAALSAAIAADASAAAAVTRAALSAKAKMPSAAVDKMAADAAVQAADRAGAKLSATGNELRAEAASQARAAAISAAQANPKDATKAALVDAWTMLINKASATAIISADKGTTVPVEPKSWFSQRTGPVPNWGLVAGGLGALALAAKKFLL